MGFRVIILLYYFFLYIVELKKVKEEGWIRIRESNKKSYEVFIDD